MTDVAGPPRRPSILAIRSLCPVQVPTSDCASALNAGMDRAVATVNEQIRVFISEPPRCEPYGHGTSDVSNSLPRGENLYVGRDRSLRCVPTGRGGRSHMSAARARPHAEEHRSVHAQGPSTSTVAPRCVSKHEAARGVRGRPHPSRRIHESQLTCMDAPQDEGGMEALPHAAKSTQAA